MIVGYISFDCQQYFLESERRYGSDGNRDVRNVAAGRGIAFVGEYEVAGDICRHRGVLDAGAGDRPDRDSNRRGQGAKAWAGDGGSGTREAGAGHEGGPKVKIITENLVETSHVVRAKAREFDATASELNMKARVQAARVDGMVSSVLNTTAEISETLQRAVKVPVRELTGLVNGFKAGVGVLVGRAKGVGAGTG